MMIFLKTLKSKREEFDSLNLVVEYLNENLNQDTSIGDLSKMASDIVNDKIVDLSLSSFFDELNSTNLSSFEDFYTVAPQEKISFSLFSYSITLLKKFLLKEIKTKLVGDDMYHESIPRKIIPEVEAYNYAGMNFLDISPTGREYGLLFE